MKIKQLTCALLLAFGLTANAANTITKVPQVSTEVTLSDDVDYVITNATPFAGEGKVNITNTEHAVLIIQSIRPSLVIKNHLKDRVFINGEQAVNGENCQVKMYAHGAIIMPYAKDIKPLTVYSEPNFGGTAVNDFGLEHSGGFMNTLSEAKLNNQIRSFKLKRGYMVTFATGKSGWGYSRCFIADKEDLEFSELPAHLDGRISSYRVFQWYDAEKKGLASDTRQSANDLLATSWCYDWATGFSHQPDRECVPHQIYVAWPSASACGSATYACHMKTNNEPGNSADDTPQSVEVILNQWQELMRTGLRLCSESSHDGSWQHLKDFISAVDARGWRCDILDLHCYWASGFDRMQNYYNDYGKRPIWISEFVWGASWNNNGIFATDRSFSQANQQKNLDAMKGIFNTLNNSPYVERYAYWNSEADCSKLLRGESELSLTGKHFQTMQSGMAYRKEYEKIPNVVYTSATNVSGAWTNQEVGAFKLSWTDTNGDMLSEIQVQRRPEGENNYEVVGVITPKDQSGKTISYYYTDTLTEAGVFEYRVVNVTAENTTRNSGVVRAAKSSIKGAAGVQYGEILMIDGEEVTMDYTEAFADAPAIFMGAVSNSNTGLYPGNLVTGNSRLKISYKPLPWATSTSTSYDKAESIPFFAISEGNYQFSNLDCEVGVVKVNMVDTADVVFAKPFPEGVVPVILTEVRKPTLKENPIIVKIRNVTNTGFKCILMYEDKVGTPSALKSNVCYMAITPGVGVIDEAKGLMVAAGVSEANAYGSSARSVYFTHESDTLRFAEPYIFANLQTSNYDAATMLRRQGAPLTEKVDGVSYTVGARFKRVVDTSRKNASDGTKLSLSNMKDDLGWMVLYTRAEGTSEPTSIEEVDVYDTLLRPYAVDGVIYVDGCEDFDVYTLHGVKMAQHSTLLPGVYVVKAGSSTAMVVVK
ncbi:MAG: hypothetical protein J6V12_00880 [Bacteroidaceae bacterium]|nr:hypothetical protein [Bacteroidaceae bacterium]